MISGYFDSLGRPYMVGTVVIPHLRVAGKVKFLVDTGASDTLLHPRDGNDMRLPFEELSNPVARRGIGGTRAYYTESAVILLPDVAQWRRFAVELYIAPPHPTADYLPSLLGRDVLNRVRMEYDFPERRLEFAAGAA